MERWVGRVALVTGASSGMGYSIAEKLAEAGMAVVGCSRKIDKIQKLSDKLSAAGAKGSVVAMACDITHEDQILTMFSSIKEKLGGVDELSDKLSAAGAKGSVVAMACDVTQEDQILALFSSIKEKQGGVDVCVNSAGACFHAPLLSGSTDEWRAMLEIDVLGLCVTTREAVKSMRERNVDDGHIIQINSLSGHRIMKNPVYHFHAATKFALTALTEGVRNELRAAKSKIRVSQVSPGLVQTEFHERMFGSKDAANKIYDEIKCLTPEDIADSVLYMLAAPPNVQVHDILIRPVDQVT